MATLLTGLGWLLISMAPATVAYALLLPSVSFGFASTFPAAGVLVALGAQLLTQGKNLRDKNEKRSLFFLESCVKAYEEARNLLQDGNNERAKWIAAGRALAHAKELATNVTEDSHFRVLELQKLTYRRFFHGALADKKAAFFFGVKDPSIPTDQAAALSTAPEERAEGIVTSTVNELSDKALRAVWEAAAWPEDYKDPLDRGFSSEDEGKLLVLFPGLHEFLEHKKQWHSASGKLFPNKSVPPRCSRRRPGHCAAAAERARYTDHADHIRVR